MKEIIHTIKLFIWDVSMSPSKNWDDSNAISVLGQQLFSLASYSELLKVNVVIITVQK